MIGKFIYRLLIFSFMLAGIFCLLLSSSSFKLTLSETLSEKFLEHTGYTCKINNWKFIFPFGIEIHQLELEKEGTPQLALNQMRFQLDLEHFLTKRLTIRDLWIDQFTLNQAFVSLGGSSSSNKPIEVVHFKVDQFKTSFMKDPLLIEGSIKKSESLDAKLIINFHPVHFNLKEERFFCQTDYGMVEGKIALLPTEIRLEDLFSKTNFFTVQGSAAFNTQDSSLTSDLQGEGFDTTLHCKIFGPLTNLNFDSRIHHKKLKEMTLSGNAKWIDPICFANLSLTSAGLGTVTLQTELSFSKKLWPLTVSYANENTLAQLEGAWKGNFSDFVLNINSCNGHYLSHEYSLKEPVMIRNQEFSPLFFSFSGGTVYTTLDYIDHHIQAIVRAKDLPSQLFELWLPPLPFSSTVMVDAFLQGSSSSLTGQIQLDLERMKILDETFIQLPPLNAHCQATIKDKELECTGTIFGAGPYPITLTANLPLSCSLFPPKISLDTNQPMHAEITASGEIAPYLQLFYTDTTNISGQAQIALSMTGTLENPQLSGELTLEKGSFESYTFGTAFENIHAKIVGRGSKVHLKEFTADTEKENTITATGTLTLDSEKNYPYSFDIHTNHAPILQLDLAKITTSGPLQLKGNLSQAALTGDLTIVRADFEQPKQLSASIKQVEMTYIHQPEDEEVPTLYPKYEEFFPITLDIRMNAPGSIHFTGKDLFTEWKGDAFLKGKLSSPQLFGQVEAVRGEQLINGKMFHISQGTIIFSGNYSDKASLYVVSEHEIDDISAELVLKGQLNNPSVFFRSNPPLSQPEILSLILFNKPLPEISSLQGAQLNQTFSNLNSAANDEANILSKLRKTLGIECIEFSHSDDDGFSVKVGKYVTPGIFIFFNKSMTTDARSIAISANLVKSLKLQAEIDEESHSHLTLKWKHDY